MDECEFTSLIERKKAITQSKKYYHNQITLLIDMVNYASWLIPRARDSSNNSLADDVIIGSLYKHIVSMVDGIEVHLSNGIMLPTWLQARSAFEASVYMDWILIGDSERKAKYYYAANLRKQKLWALRFVHGTKENKIITEMISESELNGYLDPNDTELKDIAEKELAHVQEILDRAVFKEIDQSFENISRNNPSREIDWYRPLGKSSVKSITKELGRTAEYEYFYSLSSAIMHARGYQNQIKFIHGNVLYKPIRMLDDVPSLIKWIGKIFFSSTRSIIMRYRSGEIPYFYKKYANDWRTPYFNIVSVKHTFDSR